MSIRHLIKIMRSEKPDFLVDDNGRAYITDEMLFESESFKRYMELARQQRQLKKKEEVGESEKPTE